MASTCLQRGQNLRLRAWCVAHVVAPLPRPEHGAQPHADDLVLPERRQARGNLFGCKFGDGVERHRIASRLFIEPTVPGDGSAIGRGGRQVDDARHAAAPRRDQNRQLSQQIDLQDRFGIRRVARRTGGDRGSENDRVIAAGEHFLDGLLVGDIAPHHRQRIGVAREKTLRGGRQACAVEQGDPMPARQQGGGDIEPNETGAAKDQNFHTVKPHRG